MQHNKWNYIVHHHDEIIGTMKTGVFFVFCITC